MALSFVTGSTYNFSTYAPARLGQDHKTMTITSELTFSDAIRLCPSLVETFKIVYPNLPAGSVDDWRLPIYYAMSDPNGNRMYLASTWIIPSSVELVERQQQIYTISDAHLTSNDVAKILRILAQFGYNNVTYSVKSLSAPNSPGYSVDQINDVLEQLRTEMTDELNEVKTAIQSEAYIAAGEAGNAV